MATTNLEKDVWHWYHNVSECFYHIQLTIKYRKSLFTPEVEKTVLDAMKGFKERYAIDITQVGFDQNHVHILCQFLPKYSGGQVIKTIKSITAREVFQKVPAIKKELWGGEFWTDGYYVATISGRGTKEVIINYIKKQGREKDLRQLTIFDI